ncbi:MAG: LacI family DNA-binding transcriptional regulator [Alphaproteobacteria bacterium]|nr:LacI family DNA-binding transcriptional regulator [Alphaproteobacteria bacterium]
MARKQSRRGGSGVTIHDVARHAGVSPMTVSRVVNAEGNVREATRAKVTAAIKALRYAPNMAARNLAGAETVHIGLLYANPSAAYLSEFLLGSLAQSSLSGCQLVVEQCDEGEYDAIARLAAGGVHGVVLPPPLCDRSEALGAAAKAGIPAVLVASGRPDPAFSAVSINDFEAARAMTRHLLGLGHRDIAFINGHPNQTASGQRFRGFVEAMTEAGLSVDTRQTAQGYFTYRSGLEAAEKLLGGKSRPTAIFASNDDMAAAVMAVAHRKGLDVPGDLSIAGFDDTPLASAVWPALTTVRQPIADMAREAAQLLLEQIRAGRAGKAAPPVHRQLDYALVTRESTGAPKGSRKA